MRITAQLAILMLLLGATMSRAQVSNPDKLIGQPPKLSNHKAARPIEDLQWLWQYAHPSPIGRANDLRLDERFHYFLLDSFKQPQSMWGPANAHVPLSTVIPLFLAQNGDVSAAENRYVTADGCVPSFCAASGLLWIDLGRPRPLAVFAAVNWSAEGHTTSESSADYNLWLFASRQISADELPLALTEAIARWNIRLASAHRLVPHIAHALLVEPDGTPYPLDPAMAGANAIAPQPDTTTPHVAENQ